MKAKSMSKEQTLYSHIHTPNMLPDRSADVDFSEDIPENLSLTKQSFQTECDINHIVKNNALVAPLTPQQYQALNFQDLGNAVDYHTAKNYLIEAENSFMSLSADIRARFQNDPGQFLDFVQNADNQQELIDMGLATYLPDQPQPAPKPSKETFVQTDGDTPPPARKASKTSSEPPQE